MSTTEEILRDTSLPPTQAATLIVEACDSAVSLASEGKQVSNTGDTPGLEDFMWILWSNVLSIAQESDPAQPRLIEILRTLKTSNHKGAAWRIWGSETSWADLPIFGAQARERFNGTFLQRPIRLSI